MLDMQFFSPRVDKKDGEFYFKFREPQLIAPPKPKKLFTGQTQDSGLLTLRLLEQLGERVNKNGGYHTGDMYDSGLRDAAAAAGVDTTGLDTEGIKDRLRTKRIEHNKAKGADALAKAAYLSAKGAPVDVPQAELKDAVQERHLQRAAAELFDKERFSQWRKFVLVRTQSIALSTGIAINFTPPRKMWATFLVVPQANSEFFAFTALQIMGETMFSGDSNMPVGDNAQDSTINQPLDMELDTVPVTGTFNNIDTAAAHVSSAALLGWLERMQQSRR